VFPGIGHGVMYGSTCARDVVNSFFARPGAPDTSCVANVKPPVFDVR
jgi:hypothetical protein